MIRFSLVLTFSLFSLYCISQINTSIPNCDPIWQEGRFGQCIGKNNSLLKYDVDQDGQLEIIANTGKGSTHFWYILKYNPIDSFYRKIHISEFHTDFIDKMILADLNDDGFDELLLAIGESLHVFNLQSLETTHVIDLKEDFASAFWYPTIDIRFNDIDNDGEKEIIASNLRDLVIINSKTLSHEHYFDRIDPHSFDIGNVDEDSELEIVFISGEVWQMDNDYNYIVQFDFRPNQVLTSASRIELINLDNDLEEEAFIIGGPTIALEVLSFDTLFRIFVDLDLDGYLIEDVNQDGILDFIYGEGQGGKIIMHNGETGEKIWEYDNGHGEISAILVDNFDNQDGNEIIWTMGCNTNAKDNIYAFDLDSLTSKWVSVDESPYIAIEIEDIDQDGELEILTLSSQSNSGQDFGILTIFDLATRNIEFQMDEDYIPFSKDDPFHGITIVDHLNDGDLDIFLGGGNSFVGSFWVIDGSSHEIEFEHDFPRTDSINRVRRVFYEDIDLDGQFEYIIESSDWKIFDQNLQMTNKSISYYNGNSSIKPTYNIGNLDQDPEIEFVSLSNYLLQFDNNLELLPTDSLRYSAYSLFDWDQDGDLDIVAAYYTSGFGAISGIRILDESSNVLKDFPLGNNILINSVEVTDINKDGINELVCAANNILYFINSEDGTFSKGDLNLRSVGQYQAIEMIDYDNDGTLNLFLGSYHTITELDLDCAQCLWYEASLQKDDSKCSENNGKLIGQSSDSNTIFNIENDTLTFVDSLNGLSAGYYKVIASNNQMCSLEFEFDINQFDLKAQINSENLKCFGDNDGQIEVIVTEGANPIEFDWSNGSNTNQIDSLSSGLYIINITDSLNCKIQDSIEITSPEKLSATFVLYQQDDPDTPEGEGSIGTFVSGGAFPYQFLWSTGETNFIIRNLEANSYSLKIIDENNCELDTFAVVDYTTNVENLTDAIAKIYPNPTNGYVQIEAKENLYFDQYQIFAINGQLIKTGKINSLNKQVELDLSDLISGEYLLLLSVGNKNYQTIIKKI